MEKNGKEDKILLAIKKFFWQIPHLFPHLEFLSTGEQDETKKPKNGTIKNS